MSKTYVIGDLHGNYKGLVQAIERSPFAAKDDTLISLGDLVDGGPDSYEVIDYLSKLPNCVLIKGNHDEWFKQWMTTGVNPVHWLQGQHHTAQSYINHTIDEHDYERKLIQYKGGYECNLTYFDIPENHRDFLFSAEDYHIDIYGNCFVHGGFNRHLHIEQQQIEDIYYWDRDLWMQALSFKTVTDSTSALKFKMKDNFRNIFIGHTSTLNWGKTTPMKAANIINIDTGAGFNGVVTIMDVESHDYWSSDLVKDLYGEEFKR